MKALLCVFSGTGNTLLISKRLAGQLQSRGIETEIFNIRHGNAIPGCHCDMLIIAYPVHAFNAPSSVLRFMKKLPEVNKIPAYLVRTSGEPLRLNDSSGITPRRILRKKGFKVLGEYAYVMPYNIIFKHSEGMAARMMRAAELRIKKDSEEIARGIEKRQKVNIFRRFVSFVLRIEHTAMPIIGRRFKATDKCIGCGICAKKCPQGNITIKDGKPQFGKHCVGCMACAFTCPKDALKISVLNGWRVNGIYSFDGAPATDEEVCNYCKKAYLRYFHESESLNSNDTNKI